MGKVIFAFGERKDFRELLRRKRNALEERAAELAHMRADKWTANARHTAECRHKWECSLTHDEAAAAMALKEILYPGMSRYALVRLLMLAWIDAAAEHLGVQKEIYYAEEK